ncbi:hypothetical protein K504DRAFT_502379 [Pleomassaria siparia CBS 279.74]|uniref:Uncharacterized protein n=1 Tax=Pleomassaria siparia CBS 279.74 TaxID=1314801 RepID=A0A6G1KB20_9PLEO|nr:hypothetical protein K504DRAFT_502379 [Pleomassaria siparia CBS 279.74]
MSSVSTVLGLGYTCDSVSAASAPVAPAMNCIQLQRSGEQRTGIGTANVRSDDGMRMVFGITNPTLELRRFAQVAQIVPAASLMRLFPGLRDLLTKDAQFADLKVVNGRAAELESSSPHPLGDGQRFIAVDDTAYKHTIHSR